MNVISLFLFVDTVKYEQTLGHQTYTGGQEELTGAERMCTLQFLNQNNNIFVLPVAAIKRSSSQQLKGVSLSTLCSHNTQDQERFMTHL